MSDFILFPEIFAFTFYGIWKIGEKCTIVYRFEFEEKVWFDKQRMNGKLSEQASDRIESYPIYDSVNVFHLLLLVSLEWNWNSTSMTHTGASGNDVNFAVFNLCKIVNRQQEWNSKTWWNSLAMKHVRFLFFCFSRFHFFAFLKVYCTTNLLASLSSSFCLRLRKCASCVYINWHLIVIGALINKHIRNCLVIHSFVSNFVTNVLL